MHVTLGGITLRMPRRFGYLLGAFFLSVSLVGAFVPMAYASTVSPGGDTTVVDPTTDGVVSVLENAREPESPNIRLAVPTLSDTSGSSPDSIRVVSVTGGILKEGGGGSITLGTSGTILSLTSGHYDFRFTPDANRKVNATFDYAVVDPDNTANNSATSTATITISENDVAPGLATDSGSTGSGLAGRFYLNSYDLTGSYTDTLTPSINFNTGNDGSTPITMWGVDNVSPDDFGVRWTGQVEAPVTGNYTFSTISDDGIRVWVDGNKIIDDYTTHGPTTDTSSSVALVAGQKYTIELNYYERGGGEEIVLRWSYPGQSTQVIPTAQLFPGTTRPALTFVNGQSAAVVDDTITPTDSDDANLATSTVAITSNYHSDQDSLSFTNQNGITGSWNSSTGVLTLTGTTTVANYQTALRSITYANASSTPNSDTRTITFTVSDGQKESPAVYRNIEFTGTNHAPAITEGASTSVSMDKDATPTAFSLRLHATDQENQATTWSIFSTPSHGSASASGTAASTTVSYTPTSGYIGTDSFKVQVADTLNATSTIQVNVTVRDTEPPALSAVTASSTASTTASVGWTTDKRATTKVVYSADEAFASSTTESDTGSGVTSHSAAITSLLSCTLYNYKVISDNLYGHVATSTVGTFLTTGCPGSATPSASTSTPVTVSSAATTTLTTSGRTLTVVTPANVTATSSSIVIQIKGLSSTPVLDDLGMPSSSLSSAASVVFDVTALINNTTVLDSFDSPVTITYNYTDADVSGLDESTLTMYHYHDGAWLALSSCTVDTSANTITCNAPSFSTFAIFGTQVSNSSSSVGAIPASFNKTNPLPGEVATEPSATTTITQTQGKSAAVTSVCTPPSFTRDLEYGLKGSDVHALQHYLNCEGFLLGTSGPGAPGEETIYFVNRTKASLIRFQEAHAAQILTPLHLAHGTGYFGPLTRAFIKSTH